jgi:hypothetical protein
MTTATLTNIREIYTSKSKAIPVTGHGGLYRYQVIISILLTTKSQDMKVFKPALKHYFF